MAGRHGIGHHGPIGELSFRPSASEPNEGGNEQGKQYCYRDLPPGRPLPQFTRDNDESCQPPSKKANF